MSLVAIYLLLDYINIPSIFGIKVSNINMDMAGIVINSAVTVVMFLTTYYLIDLWETQKHMNQRETAKKLLVATYRLCEKFTIDLDKHNIRDFVIHSKIDSEDSEKMHLPFFENYEKVPFVNNDRINQFFMDGVLSYDHLITYTKIKGLYESYVKLITIRDKLKHGEDILKNLRSELLTTIGTACDKYEK